MSSGGHDLRSHCTVIHEKAGHALAGEQIIVQARHIGIPTVLPGTSTHKVHEIILRVNALCLLDRSFKLKEQRSPMRLRENPPAS